MVRLGVISESPSKPSLPIELLTKTVRVSALGSKVVQPAFPSSTEVDSTVTVRVPRTAPVPLCRKTISATAGSTPVWPASYASTDRVMPAASPAASVPFSGPVHVSQDSPTCTSHARDSLVPLASSKVGCRRATSSSSCSLMNVSPSGVSRIDPLSPPPPPPLGPPDDEPVQALVQSSARTSAAEVRFPAGEQRSGRGSERSPRIRYEGIRVSRVIVILVCGTEGGTAGRRHPSTYSSLPSCLSLNYQQVSSGFSPAD